MSPLVLFFAGFKFSNKMPLTDLVNLFTLYLFTRIV